MADIITMVAAALFAAWKAVEYLETGQSFREQRHAAGFDKRVVKNARSALESNGGVEARAAARLLGDPVFAAYAADPDDSARFQALSDRVKGSEGLKGLIGPGVDEEEVFAVLARAWVAAALADAKPVEALLVARQGVTNDTLLAIIDLAVDAHTKQDAAAAEIGEVLARLRVDPSELLVHNPFLAQDVDLAGAFTMASEVTDDDVPPYVARDVDPLLDQLLADADVGAIARFVAVAGPTKSGKTRCLLEALSRTTPLHLVYTVRRTTGHDTLTALLTELAQRPPHRRWIVLVDDLYPHLADGAALAAAARKVAEIDPPGLIVATTTAATLTLTKTERLAAGINSIDIELIKAQHVELPLQATPAEQARAQATLGDALTLAGGGPTDLPHFPERLAAIPELRARLVQVLGDPDASPRLALMLAATQLALARGNRALPTAELRELARCIHRYLGVPERRSGRLTDNDLDDAETWATTRVGVAYALLIPAVGTDDHLEVLDAALDQLGHRAINPRFRTCTSSLLDAAHLGAVAFIGFADQDAAIQWTHPAADAGMTEAMVILGALLKERGDEGDLAQAEKWYRRAADAGNTQASYILGHLVHERGGEAEAERWWTRAGNAGHTDAMYNLGVLHRQRGGESDLAQAEKWYRRASDAGHTDAMYNLGLLYKHRGGGSDLTRAEKWYRRAADAGHTQAMYSLGHLVHERGGEAEAKERWTRAALAGHAEAMASLGVLLHGRGGEGDLTQAEKWYRRAAATGQLQAMVLLGVLLEQRGSDGDLAQAEEWWTRAADAGNPQAMYNLGVLLHERGGDGDLAQAEEWWTRAADSKDPDIVPWARQALATIRGGVDPQ